MGIYSFLNDIGNYESRKVAKDEAKSGIIVSTVFTSDEGYETALLDKNGAHPVERYSSKAGAIKGHKKWLSFADKGNGKKITKLGGLGGLIDSEKITLKI